MNGLALREPSEIHLVNQASPTVDEKRAMDPAPSMARTLEQLALKLLLEAQSLTEAPGPDVRGGVDFYEEVKRFEINLLQRALVFTCGNQVRAARLLNMKVTTLNSKVKHYGIDIDALIGAFLPLKTAEVVHNQA